MTRTTTSHPDMDRKHTTLNQQQQPTSTSKEDSNEDGSNQQQQDLRQVLELTEPWDNYKEEYEQFLRNMPKIELHVHLDGSFDPAIVQACLDQQGTSCLPVHTVLPWDNSHFPVRRLVQECRTPNEFSSLCCCRGKYSLYEMLKCFEIFLPIVRGNLQLLEHLALDFCKRQAQQRIIYTEVRYSPHLLVVAEDDGSLSPEEEAPAAATSSASSSTNATNKQMVTADAIVTAITRGLRKGEQTYGIQVNQILCCINWRPDWAEDVIRLAHERKNDTPCAVVGVDIAAGEEHFDQDRFPHLYHKHYQAMQTARRLQLDITIHAGEVQVAGDTSTSSCRNIRHAVQVYGASRIGHGYNVVDDPKLMKELKDQNIHFEVCPTSSVETGGWSYRDNKTPPATEETKKDTSPTSNPTLTKNWKTHPCVVMMEHGMNVGFNSDDPAVFDTSLTWQLRIAMGKMGIAKERLLQANRDSIDAAFLNAKGKRALHEIVSAFASEEPHWPEQLLRKHNFQDRVGVLSKKKSY